MLAAVEVSNDVVRLEDVSCRFGVGAGAVVASDGVSVQVSPGSFVVVMGATGSGKSTLLNCAAGLIRPTAGLVWLAGRRIDGMGERALTQLRRDEVGFVFQSYNLLSELTVAQNVLLPRRFGARRSRPLGEVLEAVGLSGFGDRRVGELSGGQRQRVAIARALSTRPRVVFADEPTGALDPSTGAHVLGLLRRAVDGEGVTVVMVSHDPHAAAVSDRLLLLRSGRLVDDRPTPDAATIAERLRAISEPVAAAGVGAGW
jgi:putative ABC transport system ATP-binding protein